MLKCWIRVFALAAVLLCMCLERIDVVRAVDKIPEYCNHTINLGAKGYDVVSYFTLEASADGRPGSDEFKTTYKNATFWFSSATNLHAFEANPTKYLPAFGGFCAYGMAKFPSTKEELEMNPPIGPPICPKLQWTVFNGTLYLNDCDTRDLWLAHRDEYIQMANERWIGYWGSLRGGPINIDCFGP